MITQKDALKNILETIDSHWVRYNAVINWLEDINWHRECSLLSERVPKMCVDELKTMEKFNYVLNQSNYDQDFVNEFIKENPLVVRSIDLAKINAGYYSYGGYIFTRSQIADFNKSETFFRVFNNIFGWGLQLDGWTSNGQGEEFVNELVQLLDEINQ